jgi:hypothetical protein
VRIGGVDSHRGGLQEGADQFVAYGAYSGPTLEKVTGRVSSERTPKADRQWGVSLARRRSRRRRRSGFAGGADRIGYRDARPG